MKKKKINSNNLLLLITIVLFFVMYAAGCIVYADKGFTRFQTFLNILINNAGLICITAGMTCVMLTGGIDISVGFLGCYGPYDPGSRELSSGDGPARYLCF